MEIKWYFQTRQAHGQQTQVQALRRKLNKGKVLLFTDLSRCQLYEELTQVL